MIEFSDAVLDKARRLSDEDVQQDGTYPEIWWVQGNSEQPYRVQLGTDKDDHVWYATCTCAHGLKAGGGQPTCYHVAAVLMRVKGETNDFD